MKKKTLKIWYEGTEQGLRRFKTLIQRINKNLGFGGKFVRGHEQNPQGKFRRDRGKFVRGHEQSPQGKFTREDKKEKFTRSRKR